jgi:hypothetical protein
VPQVSSHGTLIILDPETGRTVHTIDSTHPGGPHGYKPRLALFESNERRTCLAVVVRAGFRVWDLGPAPCPTIVLASAHKR